MRPATIHYEGRSLREWSRLSGIPISTINTRLYNGWPIHRAVKDKSHHAPLYEHAGQSLSLVDWSRQTGIGLSTLNRRLRMGWTISDTLSVTPASSHNRQGRRLTHNGTTLSVSEWARRTGIKRETIKERLRRGWTVTRALGFDEPRVGSDLTVGP